MKRLIIILAVCSVAWLQTAGQNITSAEFFIDTDPGAGKGTALNIGSSGSIVNFVANISTASLPTGFHFLAIRTRGADGKWGLFESRGFYISSSVTNAANITAGEFFIDADPGAGNGTSLNIGSSGGTINFIANISTASLQPGFHFLAIRTKGSDGKWGFFESRGFYISSSVTNAANITEAEFFIDADPGAGNGTALNIGSSGGVVNFIASISTASLQPGFHFLAIRTKGSDGKWGLFESRGFYISSSVTNAANITAGEFFIDTDPGAGKGTSLNIGSSGGTVNFVAAIPTASLPVGFHTLAIRVKGADGKWGLFEKRAFFISPNTNNTSIIVAAEFFIDADPGNGNGSPLTVTNPGNVITEDFICPVPLGMTDGTHYLAIRVKDSAGVWSPFALDSFIVDHTLPVTGLFFSGENISGKIYLQWHTLTEINTSYFEIERSSNGIDFSTIGRVTAAGNSSVRRDYNWTDNVPLKQLNFYRLKEVDKDGKISYSPIIRIVINDDNSITLKLYPNPANSYINISFITDQSLVLVNIYDSRGRLVRSSREQVSDPIRINISVFAAGKYYVYVSDGARQRSAWFVK